MQEKPVLFGDIDGAISLWDLESNARPDGALHNVDGIVLFLSSAARNHLLARGAVSSAGAAAARSPPTAHALALPGPLPFLPFERNVRGHAAHAARPIASGGCAGARADVYGGAPRGNARGVHSEDETRYDPDEDPDTDAATTPDEVEQDSQRDQAEGSEEQVGGDHGTG